MKLPSIPYLADAFLGVVRRFPLVMLAAAAGVVVSMVLIEHDTNIDEDECIKILMTCSLGLTSLLCASIICERWKLSFPAALAPHLVVLGLLGLYYFTLESIDDIGRIVTPVRFFGLNLAAHLAVAFLPYLDQSPVEDFWEYNKRLFGNFMVGAFYSLVIFAGLSFAILAVNELFNLNIDEKIYAHLFVVLAGIFNTAYFLAHFPKRFDFETESVENQELATPTNLFTSPLKNLTKFILIPIVAIYFLILYAFSAKILIQWELPEGWVGKLVLGFSVAGIFTYLLNYLMVKFDESFAVQGFRRWFFYVLLPMVVLLFVAIGRRMGDYGVTEARYVVATSGVWLLLMSVYFIFSKRDNIKFIPISLAFFSLVTVLGPFNAFKVSERSQVGRLEATLEKNNMLKDGKIVAATDSLDNADAEIIRTTINYLQNNGHYEKLVPMLGLSGEASKPDWQTISNLLIKLGIEQSMDNTKTCSVYFDTNNEQVIEITGYNQLYRINAYQKAKLSDDFTGFQITDGMTGLQYVKNGQKQDSFDLRPYCQKLQEKGLCNEGVLHDSLSVFEASAAGFDLKFLVESLSFEDDGNLKIRDFNGRALLRSKQ